MCLLLLFQLSAVEAGGSTAFIYANFSVPVVKVRGTCTSPQEWGMGGGGGGVAALPFLISYRESQLSLSQYQIPICSSLMYWGAQVQPWISGLHSRGTTPKVWAFQLSLRSVKPQPRNSQIWGAYPTPHFGVLILNPEAPTHVLG